MRFEPISGPWLGGGLPGPSEGLLRGGAPRAHWGAFWERVGKMPGACWELLALIEALKRIPKVQDDARDLDPASTDYQVVQGAQHEVQKVHKKVMFGPDFGTPKWVLLCAPRL